MTGKCIPPNINCTSGSYAGKMCEIYSWCPVEYDVLPMPGHNYINGEDRLSKLVLFELAQLSVLLGTLVLLK